VRLRELLIRRLLGFEPAEPEYVPALLWPGPPGDEVLEDGPPMDIAGAFESSIIITACRRFAPAPITMGVSGNWVAVLEDGGSSERNVEGEVCIGCCTVEWKSSFVGVGRTLVGRPRDSIGGGGEGDEGDERSCVFG